MESFKKFINEVVVETFDEIEKGKSGIFNILDKNEFNLIKDTIKSVVGLLIKQEDKKI